MSDRDALREAFEILHDLSDWWEWKPDEHPGQRTPYVGDIANRARRWVKDARTAATMEVPPR